MKTGKAAKQGARGRKTETFSEVLPRFVASLGGQEQAYFFHLLARHWENIAGPSVSLHVRPVRMEYKKLFLAADAPVWSNELRYMEQKLVEKINAFACKEIVKEICFCAPGEGIFGAAEKIDGTPPPKIEIAPEDCEGVGEMVSGAENEELREAAFRAIAQNKALRRNLAGEKWAPCEKCGRLASPGKKLCFSCERKKREEEENAARLLLRREPWLHGREVSHILGCSLDTAARARYSLLRSLASRLPKGDETSEEAKKLVMLFASAKPEALTGPMISKSLERLRFDLLPDRTSSKGSRNRK